MKDGALKEAVEGRMGELGYPPLEPWAWLAMVGVERPNSRAATEWLVSVIETVLDCFADESPDTIVDLYSDWGGNDLAHEVADGAVPVYNGERVDLCAWAGWYRLEDEDGWVDWSHVRSLPDLAGVILYEKARLAAEATVRFVKDLSVEEVAR